MNFSKWTSCFPQRAHIPCGHAISPPPQTIILLGPSNSGKTTLLNRLIYDAPKDPVPTIFYNTHPLNWKNNTYTIHDIGGDGLSLRTKPHLDSILDSNSCVFFVVKCSASESNHAIEVLRMNLPYLVSRGVKRLWIVPNKQDLEISEKDILVVWESQLREEVRKLCMTIGGGITPRYFFGKGISALKGWGVNELLDDVRVALDDGEAFGIDPAYYSARGVGRETELALMEARVFRREADERTRELDLQLERMKIVYGVLLQCMAEDESIIDAEAKLCNWRYGEGNRTMRLFYLQQLQSSILAQGDAPSKALPSLDQFNEIAAYNTLTGNFILKHPESWKTYYSQQFMDNPLTSKYYRLPDLQDHPVFHGPQKPSTLLIAFTSSYPTEQRTHIPRFTFTLVKTYLSSTLTRNNIVQTALPILQQYLIRLRSSEREVPAFSETQVSFWIGYMHALLTHFSTKDFKGLDFETLLSLGWIDLDAWRSSYSVGVWEGIEARMGYVQPDRKAVREESIVFHVDVEKLQGQMRGRGGVYELEGEAELRLLVEVAVLEVCERSDIENGDMLCRGEVLYWAFRKACFGKAKRKGFVVPDADERPVDVDGGRQGEYWTKEVELALARTDEYWLIFTTDKGRRVETFRAFLLENMHLVREMGTLELNVEELDEKGALMETSKEGNTENRLSCSTIVNHGEKEDGEEDDDDTKSIASTAWEVV